ncbi:MAG: GNAT family N-acetyltransferase [Euryarchaeota archaeon]|nr:GNAT family N-acetyltransferase [Euryarchaeota archaeon]MDE1879438.1 GNAT family N-acetyltransferase [Euryarchaeota archaeon]
MSQTSPTRTASSVPPAAQVTPAAQYHGDLLKLLVEMRRALKARGESLPPTWPEEAEGELRAKRMLGWVLEPRGERRGLAVLAVRNGRGFGQIHFSGGPQELPGAMEMVRAVDTHRPPGMRRIDLAVSADPEETESAWGKLLDAPDPKLTFTVVHRRAMVRKLDPSLPPPAETLPERFRFVPALALGPALLASIDFPSFVGGPDEAMVAETPEDNERLLRGLLEGDLGAPLREASAAVVLEEESSEGPKGHLVGFSLCLEENPHSALLADIAVLPKYRKQGIGKAILARSLRGLVALGFTEARLWVTEANTGALKLYERAGFTTERVGRILRWTAPRAS